MTIDNPSKARELARGIVSDILLYNGPRVRSGIRRDNLFEALADEIAQGRKFYASQTARSINDSHNFFNDALVDLLLAANGDIPSDIW
ncbi:MAG: hypothetical protein P9M14_01720 [Candidatus Alcyoniella australis]|nr:hypothetical protein [Candidatus Alcyoniella australis]